jgi:hypothetical protein
MHQRAFVSLFYRLGMSYGINYRHSHGHCHSSFTDWGCLTGSTTDTVTVTANTAGDPGMIRSNFTDFPSPLSGERPAWQPTGMNDVHTLTANFTVGNPGIHGGNGTAKNGYRYVVMLIQDRTGGRTVTWASDYKFGWRNCTNHDLRQRTRLMRMSLLFTKTRHTALAFSKM